MVKLHPALAELQLNLMANYEKMIMKRMRRAMKLKMMLEERKTTPTLLVTVLWHGKRSYTTLCTNYMAIDFLLQTGLVKVAARRQQGRRPMSRTLMDMALAPTPLTPPLTPTKPPRGWEWVPSQLHLLPPAPSPEEWKLMKKQLKHLL